MNDKKPWILIVDDERSNLNILNKVLKDDYQIKVALNGQEALQRAMADPLPDMILLDIRMPDMDGYAVCMQLKSTPVTREIPVIFITSMTEDEDEQRGLLLGAVDYITKPLRPSIILARIQTHLKLKQARESLADKNAILKEMLALRETVEYISQHDLKVPLNAILGVTQILADTDYLRPEEQQWIAMQEKAAYNMLEMINRSMDLLKMEHGSYILNPQPVDLLPTIQRILNELHHPAVVLLLDDSPVSPEHSFMIQGEELLCYSMLANLIKNAVEASPNDTPITISLHTETTPVIRIHNSGMVPQEIRHQFFEKYVTLGKPSGTGLGTYSAKLIATTLGGHIRMETSEEAGTSVIIHLNR